MRSFSLSLFVWQVNAQRQRSWTCSSAPSRTHASHRSGTAPPTWSMPSLRSITRDYLSAYRTMKHSQTFWKMHGVYKSRFVWLSNSVSKVCETRMIVARSIIVGQTVVHFMFCASGCHTSTQRHFFCSKLCSWEENKVCSHLCRV